MDAPVLRLYVSHRTARSRQAVLIFDRLCRGVTALGGSCEVLDVADVPERAEADRILATPTLIRDTPGPVRRIVGEIADVETLLTRLELPRELLDGA